MLSFLNVEMEKLDKLKKLVLRVFCANVQIFDFSSSAQFREIYKVLVVFPCRSLFYM